MSFVLPFTTPPRTEIFTVEDTVAQLIWRGLPTGDLTVLRHDGESTSETRVGTVGPIGAAEIADLPPNTSVRLELVLDGRPIAAHDITTAPTIDDGPITKIATISDLHLGEQDFGVVRKFREQRETVPYPLRCALAAVREAEAWGAELLVIKGDITELGRPEEWELFDTLLAAISIPVLAIPGNHDTFNKPGSLDAETELQRRGLFPSPVHVHDLDHARLVAADSTVPTHSYGRLSHQREALLESLAVDSPVLLFAHHHLEPRPVPCFWPLGIRRFDTAALLREMAEANPDLLISSGHTHRTRARYEAGVAITEVGSTKDYPGVWAGYAIHRSGVRQVVRRVAEPTCVTWTERTHAVVAGLWGRWSPGRLDDRSFTHRWSTERTMLRPDDAVQSALPGDPSERV